MDGGTQVISFILNFAVFGAAGTAHSFPQWVRRLSRPDSMRWLT
jgi:hypothetical protein